MPSFVPNKWPVISLSHIRMPLDGVHICYMRVMGTMKHEQITTKLMGDLNIRNQGWRQGRARGGYSPLSEHASPLRRKVKHSFFGDFWHLQYPESSGVEVNR